MTEFVAPHGYGEIKTALTFKIENGKVQRTDSNDTTTNPDYDKYDVSEATTEKGNTITMFDKKEQSGPSISLEKRA